MSHPEQLDFVKEVRDSYPPDFIEKRVLEIGSRQINGEIRSLFTDCDYLGIDSIDGPGVDIRILAHDLPDRLTSRGEIPVFDTIVCCEVFEHDPHLLRTLYAIRKMLSHGGLFIATWAGPSRGEHGTVRTESNPVVISSPDPDFYQVLDPGSVLSAIESWLPGAWMSVTADGSDVYLRGRKCT